MSVPVAAAAEPAGHRASPGAGAPRATRQRIGLLHQYRLNTSGSGVYLRRLAEHLLEQGHAVSLMTHDPRPAISLPILSTRGGRSGDGPACRIHSLRAAGTPVAYPRAEEPRSVLLRDLSDAALSRYLSYHVDRVTRLVERDSLDVLHANSEIAMSYVAAMVARRTGVPYVTVAHGSTLEYVYNVDSRYRRLCRIGLMEAARIVVLNADVKERVLAVVPEVADRLRVVPPGVDCSVFGPQADRPQSRAPVPSGHGPVVAYVGRVSTDKGAFALVGCFAQVAARLPGTRLVVVGDGPERPALEALTSALDYNDASAAERVLRQVAIPADEPWVSALVSSWAAPPDRPAGRSGVIFTGQLPAPQVAAQMAAADVVVVPSLVREAFPLVVLEALASGTPPLAVDAGGLGAVLAEITPQLGQLGSLLALPADAESLIRGLPSRVALLLDWLAEPGHREQSRRQCRALALDGYSWQHVGARLEALYREAAETGTRKSLPDRVAAL